MKKILTYVISIAFLLSAIVFITSYNKRIETKRYAPHIYTLTGGKVLVVKISGDPDFTLDTAQTTLYSARRKLKLSPSYITARHLDWQQRETTPRKQWVVYYSRRVPETATGLADIENTADVNIFL